ncbi:DUF1616 domain-containing protein [Patescibacteria group bacterium]|nr:DUF1616 domain-containing protein [Patescibacteria group bacterium]
MIIQITNFTGLILSIFLPGFLLSLILFKKNKLQIIERLVISFGLSVAISIIIGLFLCIIKVFFDILGITKLNLYLGLLVVSLTLCLILLYKKPTLLFRK